MTPDLPLSPETKRLVHKLNQLEPHGLFATGIENSDPWIDGLRRNQLSEAFDFTTHYKERLDNIKKLGIPYLRFGVVLSQIWPEENRYDFELLDKVIGYCQKLSITLILDLLHFGLPEWL